MKTAVRWRNVLPLSGVLLTLFAVRNLIIYAGTLQQEELTAVEDPADIVNDERHGVRLEAFLRRDSPESRRVGDDRQNSREDLEQLAPFGANNDENRDSEVNRRASDSNENNRAALNPKFEAFQLFPDDNEAQQDHQEGAPDDLKREDDDGLEKKLADKANLMIDIDAYHKGNDDGLEKKSADNENDDYQPDTKKGKPMPSDDRNPNQDETNESDKAVEVAQLTNNEAKLLNPIELRDKYYGLLKENSSMVDDEAAVMMANMGEVGKIVRNMKRQSANGVYDREDGADSHQVSDKKNPLKPHPFKYLINSPKICAPGDDGDDRLFLVVYVHTAPDHYKRRMVIRQTWGAYGQYDEPVRLVFVMGIAAEDSSTQNAVMFEAEQFNDIVQEDFVDSYHNLTHKGVAALRWIDVHCRHAIFVLKTDDDIFINMFTLIRYLKKLTRTSPRPRGVLMCLVWESMPVLREGKWKVTKEEWPEDSYPTYCSGSAFVMSTDVAVSFHRVSYDVPFFWVDDFYITGLLPLKLGNITHHQFASAYVLNGELLERTFTGPQWFTYVFSHVHNLDRIQSVWETLTQLVKGRVVAAIQYRTASARQLQLH